MSAGWESPDLVQEVVELRADLERLVREVRAVGAALEGHEAALDDLRQRVANLFPQPWKSPGMPGILGARRPPEAP